MPWFEIGNLEEQMGNYGDDSVDENDTIFTQEDVTTLFADNHGAEAFIFRITDYDDGSSILKIIPVKTDENNLFEEVISDNLEDGISSIATQVGPTSEGKDRTFFEEDVTKLFTNNPEAVGFIVRAAQLIRNGFEPTPLLANELENTLVLISVNDGGDLIKDNGKKIVVPCPPLNHDGGTEIT